MGKKLFPPIDTVSPAGPDTARARVDQGALFLRLSQSVEPLTYFHNLIFLRPPPIDEEL